MDHASILVVDDDPTLQLVLAAGLRKLGARVTPVTDIAAADAALARGGFDLIISDVHLPGNEGLQWTERLLTRPQVPPVLLLTGNPEIVTAMRAANLPVAGYLTKPLPLAALAALVQRLLDAQRQRRVLATLAGEMQDLVATVTDLPPATALRLETLSVSLAAVAAQPLREAPQPDEPWRQAIRETVAVLEKTRDSFRSKELGRLRSHLQKVLAGGAPVWAAFAGSLTEAASLISF